MTTFRELFSRAMTLANLEVGIEVTIGGGFQLNWYFISRWIVRYIIDECGGGPNGIHLDGLFWRLTRFCHVVYRCAKA